MHTSIVKVENNRITKFAEFETQETAQAHCDEHGGFVYEGSYRPDLWVDGEVVSVVEVVLSADELESQIKAQIEAIERKEIMPRKTREIQIEVMEYFAGVQGLTPEQLYEVNPAYKGMVDINNQIKALRAQL